MSEQERRASMGNITGAGSRDPGSRATPVVFFDQFLMANAAERSPEEPTRRDRRAQRIR